VSDRTLFDVSRTTTARCLVCGATREPQEKRATACEVDRLRRDEGDYRSRPAACLNTWDPGEAEIPY
jgi:hypothetical protein